MYQVQVIWNREFGFVNYGDPWDKLSNAIEFARAMENSGDGARVKKTQVVDDQDKVVWAYGKMVKE